MDQEQVNKKQHGSDVAQVHSPELGKKIIRCTDKTVTMTMPSIHSNEELALPEELLPVKFLADLEASVRK